MQARAYLQVSNSAADCGLTRGAYFFGRIGSANGLEIKNTFSDYGWSFGELDGRVYIPLGSEKKSLALRGYSLLQSPKGGSQIPFYLKPGGRPVDSLMTDKPFEVSREAESFAILHP